MAHFQGVGKIYAKKAANKSFNNYIYENKSRLIFGEAFNHLAHFFFYLAVSELHI
jgi:hypothetical protein